MITEDKTRPAKDETPARRGFDNPPESVKNLLSNGLVALREGDRPLNERELISLNSMIAYIAHVQSVPKETVRAILLATFEADTLETLPTGQFQDAVNFLVDLDLSKIMN